MISLRPLALLCAVAACALQLSAGSPLQPPPRPVVQPPPKPVVQPPPKPVVQPPPVKAQQKKQAVADSDAATFFDECPQGSDWVRYKDSCYRFYENSTYWYVAEQQCKSHSGHLTSIVDHSENSFVAKLTYCQSAWTGRYSINADYRRDPSYYRWTDGTPNNGSQFHAHDFTSITSIHEPLISVDNLKWRNKVYHAKDSFVCKVRTQGSGGGGGGCPAGWKHLRGNCYHMPAFTAGFIEAFFHCSKYSGAYMVSVYNEQELRALSLLDLASDGCPPEVWIGLVKVNPCRIDMFSGEPICYKWADRKQALHNGFPEWHAGHPLADIELEGVLLKDRAMMTVKANQKHRFICKKPASP